MELTKAKICNSNQNNLKMTFDFNFDLNQAFKQHKYTKNGNKEKLSIKKALLYLLVNLKFKNSLLKIKTLKKSSPFY